MAKTKIGTVKHCSRCKADKPATPEFFNRNKAAPDGLDLYCKPCRLEYQAERRASKKREGEKIPIEGTDETPTINKKWFLKEAYDNYVANKVQKPQAALRYFEMIAKVGGLDKEIDMDEKEMIRSLVDSMRRGEEATQEKK